MSIPSNICIHPSSIPTVVQLSQQIPELVHPYPASIYEERLKEVPCLILVAFDNKKAVAFKVGYERELDGSFYSWMGGVLPDYRRMGIARALAAVQEEWAKKQGYNAITFKTRNRLKAMLTFSINNGFDIFRIEPRATIEEYRIWLRKELL